MRRTTIAVVIVVCLLLGGGVGYVVGAYPVADVVERHVISPDHNQAQVPADIETTEREPPSFPAFDVETEQEVLAAQTHDPMVVEEDGTYYMIVGTTRDGGQQLYKSDTPADADSWALADANYLTDGFEFDSLIRTEDRYLLYGNGDVYAAQSVATDNWTKVADNTGFRDLGAYYDEETGLVHVYYEKGTAAGPSGKEIGHAVSPNGVSNWTVYPSVWTAPDDYGVGDFQVVEQDGAIYLLGDYDDHHPRYNMSVWASHNPYTGFTQLDEAAIGYDDPAVKYGVGDPTFIRHDDTCLVFANMYPSESGEPSVHLYEADCEDF